MINNIGHLDTTTPTDTIKKYTVAHFFSGIGGGALGMQKSMVEYRGLLGKFETIVGIDCDPEACQDFEMITGAPAACIDLFSREDYIAFYGHEPPLGWQEATAENIRNATRGIYPSVIFMSPPCKGFSGLLPEKASKTEKYQALNRLTIRGLELILEAFGENLPGVLLIENVPRIMTRGAELIRKIKRLLGEYGYVFTESTHNCGELGSLAQNRRRYLLIARQEEKLPTFIYEPPKYNVRAIKEVIGPMPLPGEKEAGPMHRIPLLQWKTWVRLAFIPAGGDWRDLEKISPGEYCLEHMPRNAALGVLDWDKPACAVIGNARVGGSQASAIADPRLSEKIGKTFNGSPGLMGVIDWDKPMQSITGSISASSSNCPACIADPRLSERDNRHPGVYQVIRWEETGPCITGTRFGSGAPAISDPRTNFKESTHTAIYRVSKWSKPVGTITGAHRPNNGAICISDPRLGCKCRDCSYGVMTWNEPGKTVIATQDVHNSCAAVADPRIPNDAQKGVWVIISEDGTWHRPLTTLELAALQGFPIKLPDGRPLVLQGKSDARWKERIGNAVPPPAAKAMGNAILMALLMAEFEIEFELSYTPIWVNPAVNENKEMPLLT